MSENKTLNILKQAISLEKQGKSFYEEVADKTKHPGIRKIFKIMAAEEQQHAKFLSEQYNNYQESKKLAAQNFSDYKEEELINEVLTTEIKDSISKAGFEAEAISAAIELENKTINIYHERAVHAEDAYEKTLYQMLEGWEKTHHKVLRELDKAISKGSG